MHKDERSLIIFDSYVYKLKTRAWPTITQVFDQFINNYPAFSGRNQTSVYDLTQEDVAIPHCLIQTRPIKLSGNGYKQVKRTILRRKMRVKDGTYGSVYLFGSVDGKTYKFLRGTRPQSKQEYFDVTVESLPSSIRYVIFVVAGQFLTGTQLTNFDVTFLDRYDYKIR
ncbi:MAG: hypothetical protein R6V04_05430 [bacterium]